MCTIISDNIYVQLYQIIYACTIISDNIYVQLYQIIYVYNYIR